MTKREIIEILALYLVLIVGGLWHVSNWFPGLLRWAASPVIALLGLYLFWKMSEANRRRKFRFVLWGMMIVLGGFFIEFAGVKTGRIFGDYSFGSVLQPQFSGVPLVIGFSWLGILIGSLGMAQMLVRNSISVYSLAFLTALFMVLFDLLMEPAAIYLGYWTWETTFPPLQNYLGWFVVAWGFALVGARLRLFNRPIPLFARHAYIAQVIYFGFIFLRTVLI